MATTYDAIVVGSGPGGGIATYALASAGLKVALIEAGPQLRAGIDYNGHANVYDNLERRLSAGLSPVPSVWRDRAERNHFTAAGDRPGHGLLRALGGRSICWAGHSLRFGPLDFKPWPISYEEVAPYYSRAERLMGVHGQRNGLANIPDGDFQKHVPLRCAEKLLQESAARLNARGRPMAIIPQRKAMPTEQRPGGRAVCHYCGHCMKGCEIDSKYTSANTPIPLARKTGNLTLFLESTVTRIHTDSGRRRITSIDYTDARGRVQRLDCRSLVLSCSAVETARLLLANNLANSSGQVGRNLSSHFGVTVTALFPSLNGRDGSRDEGTDYYHSLLTGLYWDKPSRDFEGTYQVQIGGGLQTSLPIRDVPGYGEGFKKELLRRNLIHAGLNMQGMIVPNRETFTDLDPARKDRFGVPLPRVHLKYTANELAMARDMVATCEEIIRGAGGEVYSKPSGISPSSLVIDSNHWAGTCRMGSDPRTSVVNRDGQSHDIPNLFLCDASVFHHYPEKNPVLTNVALSWRTAERLVAKARKGEIA